MVGRCGGRRGANFGGREYLPITFKTAKEVVRWMIENNAYLDDMELMFLEDMELMFKEPLLF